MKPVLDILAQETAWHTEKLRSFATQNFVNIRFSDNLMILNYQDDIENDEWNDFNSQCRGIIFDLHTKALIAHPYDKFFNLDAHPETKSHLLPYSSGYEIAEKYDGSMVTAFEWQGQVRFATRSSFDNLQTNLAATIFTSKYPKLSEVPFQKYTLVFEIISPENQMIIPTTENDLILIGVRDLIENRMLSYAEVINFAKPYELRPLSLIAKTFDALLSEAKDGNTDTFEEGWVVRFGTGLYVKMKTWQYLAHRHIQSLGLTKKQLLKTYCDANKSQWEKFVMNLPTSETQEAVSQFGALIDAKFLEISAQAAEYYQGFSHIDSQKDFALAIQTAVPQKFVVLLFNLRSGKSLEISIRKKYEDHIQDALLEDVVHPAMIKEWAFAQKD
ncbi:MAG: T4 RnlA family RNA ligase [Ignavibacteriae bacterium]|nr:T4 RnlA family RNA ligase [Ignavibacteriota bacterium]